MDNIQKQVLKRLKKLGWPGASELLYSFCPGSYKKLVKDYQKRNGLRADGVVGGLTMRHLQAWHFCGVPEPFGINQRNCKWPMLNPTYCVTGGVQKFSANDLKTFMDEIADGIARICPLDMKYTANSKTANILVFAERIDGLGGTLADATVPCNATPTTRLRIRMGSEERYERFDGPPPRQGLIDIARVMRHETGHIGGKFHLSKAGNLMNPMYHDNIWDWQPGDIAEWRKKYPGPPARKDAPPQPAPPPTNGLTTITIRGDVVSIPGWKRA